MNVLSLFDGMSCGQIALDQLGIPVKNYFAAEIDKYAIQVAKSNYPEMIHLGDVKEIDPSKLPKIDLLIGGSPCQGFSFGGKGLNFDDPRSKLFFEFDRLLKALKPKYFLLENVKMKKESEQVITDYLGVKPIEINSNLVSAQNRKRLYWTNIPFDGVPEDKGIMLKDILEEETAEFYRAGAYLQEKRRASDKNPDMLNPDYRSQANTIHDVESKSGTVCAGTHGYAIGYVPEIIRCGAWRGRYKPDGSTEQHLEIRKDKKTNALTTVQKDNVAVKIDNMHWRKLTVTECERLQTVPDGYTCGVSNTQRYKMLGNGWTVDVVKHIFEGLKETA